MTQVAVVHMCRTPFVKAGTDFRETTALEMSIPLLEALTNKGFTPEEFVWSTVLHNPAIPNLAREIVLRSNVTNDLDAHTVSNNCISGVVAISFLRDAILSGRINSGIAGGVESMSLPSLMVSDEARDFFLRLSRCRTVKSRLSQLLKYRPQFALPHAPSPKEPSTGLTMGAHCEMMAKDFKISRDSQDKYAVESHQRAIKAISDGFLEDYVLPLQSVSRDNIPREGTNEERLATLSPVFDRSEQGTLTAGNSSALTDGASGVTLVSDSVAQKANLNVLCYIEDIVFSSLDPSEGLLLAPARALPLLLEKNNLTLSDIDIFEIHEAFAAQVLATLKIWEQGWKAYPETSAPIGTIPQEKINIFGGSLAYGHPFAATGGRLIFHAAKALKAVEGKYAIISVCAAGGMGAVMLLKNVVDE